MNPKQTNSYFSLDQLKVGTNYPLTNQSSSSMLHAVFPTKPFFDSLRKKFAPEYLQLSFKEKPQKAQPSYNSSIPFFVSDKSKSSLVLPKQEIPQHVTLEFDDNLLRQSQANFEKLNQFLKQIRRADPVHPVQHDRKTREKQQEIRLEREIKNLQQELEILSLENLDLDKEVYVKTRLPRKKVFIFHPITLPSRYVFDNYHGFRRSVKKRMGLDLRPRFSQPHLWFKPGEDVWHMRKDIFDAMENLPLSRHLPYSHNEACVQLFYSFFLDLLFKRVKPVDDFFKIIPNFNTEWDPTLPHALIPDLLLAYTHIEDDQIVFRKPRVIIEFKKDMASGRSAATKAWDQTMGYFEWFDTWNRLSSEREHFACIALDLDNALIYWPRDNQEPEIFHLSWEFHEILVLLDETKEGMEQAASTDLRNFYAFFKFIQKICE